MTDAHSINPIATKQRLLEAAGEVFADTGFRAATIRDICRRAGNANVAAVNYHFGCKERLYEAVLKYSYAHALAKYPPDMGVAAEAPAVERLRAYIRALLMRILDSGMPSWHGRLMSREMMEPTGALEGLVRESIEPQFKSLVQLIVEIAGCGIRREQVMLCADSIVAQCLFQRQSQPVLKRLHPPRFAGVRQIEHLADHITAFSMAGITAVAACKKSVHAAHSGAVSSIARAANGAAPAGRQRPLPKTKTGQHPSPEDRAPTRGACL